VIATNQEKAARREPDGKAGEAYEAKVAPGTLPGKYIAEFAGECFVVALTADGSTRTRKVDESTIWQIYVGADGQPVVKPADNQRGWL
jgi:hypothetical protein